MKNEDMSSVLYLRFFSKVNDRIIKITVSLFLKN